MNVTQVLRIFQIVLVSSKVKYDLFQIIHVINVFYFLDCNCHPEGSNGIACDDKSGQCDCKDNIEGLECTNCTDKHYNFPNCVDYRKFFKAEENKAQKTKMNKKE